MTEKTPKGVTLEHITKIYQDPKTKKDFNAVDDVSLDIKPGSFVTLLGPSGCGKTTTLRMIAGFESPDKGEIFLGEKPINQLTPNKRDTAMVFQSYALLPHYNVFDNIAYGLNKTESYGNSCSGRTGRKRGQTYESIVWRSAAACCFGKGACNAAGSSSF